MDDDLFEPKLGRIRATRSSRGRKYLHSVLAAMMRSGVARGARTPRFAGSRIGRGGVAARSLGGRDRYGVLRVRRAVVKTRLVRLGAKALGAARAHLRYLQRDGVTREGEPGRLYSALEDQADGKAFLERCSGDRHQFRLIVSAEDGAQYEDLKPLVRRFMARVEGDLGTRLEWVAADHVDTLHPHTHIILRGKDETGANLVIAPSYISHGMRERLAGIVSLDLGPRTDLEIQRRLRLDVDAERLTPLDRRLLREAGVSRVITPAARDLFDHSVRTGRLRKLASLGLATRLDGGRWRLADDLEPALRRLGERGDVIRTMQRALTAAGIDRAPSDQAIGPPQTGSAVTGRLVARGFSDEALDRHFLLVDATDGRSHYVEIGRGDETGPLPEGAIVAIEPRPARAREVDRTIAAIADRNGGRYGIELHLASDRGAGEAFAQAHVRRLEAIHRRMPGVERLDDGSWSIPPDFVQLAERYEVLRARDAPVRVTLVSPLPLEGLAEHDGATWLDRQLVEAGPKPRDQGFGREVRAALDRRRAWLVEQGLARIEGDRLAPGPGMLAVLERRELRRVSQSISAASGLDFAPAAPGSRVEGIVRRRLELASGRFALVEDGHQFALVPWRPVLARTLGRRVAGVVRRDGAISWSIGRARGPEL